MEVLEEDFLEVSVLCCGNLDLYLGIAREEILDLLVFTGFSTVFLLSFPERLLLDTRDDIRDGVSFEREEIVFPEP